MAIDTQHINETMSLSMFNVIEEVDDDILIYNTNSCGLLKLNKFYKDKLNIFKETKIIDDTEFKQALIHGKMLINKTDGKETHKIFLENKICRFGGNTIRLTIAPTMACNFRCPYCYEKGKEYTTMNAEIIDKLKEYIQKLKKEYKYIYIMWYGGEPLLAFDIIKNLMEEVYRNFDKEYVSSGIVSNGYLLSERTVLEMKDYNINNIQITIDGPPEIHNKRRKLPTGEDTFFVILNNLKKALDVYPELLISVRINVDKTNINKIDEIEQYLKEYNLLDKLSVYIAPISNINGTCSDGNCFNVKEFALEEINFLRKNHEKGFAMISIPSKNVGMCGAVSTNSWVIDAKGDLYKCWDDIGNLSEKVGSIFQEDPEIGGKLLEWLSYSIEDDEECVQCPYLPICMGGCPNYRMKNKGKNCHSIKENASQIIRLVYEISKQRSKNNV